MPESRHLRDWTSANAALLAVAAVNAGLHMLAINRYGYHRDELYFLDCATHLDFGFVDHPPLTDFILAVTRFLLGDSLVAIRIPAVIASTLQVVFTGLMARELGGKRYAEALAGLAATFAPVYLITSGTIAVEGINTFWWAACLYLALRLAREPSPKHWLLLGMSFGLGLQAKYAIAFLGVALAVGLVLTPSRRLLSSKWPWVAAALAFVVFLPNLAWQATHGWPFLEYARSIRTHMMDWIPLHLYLMFQLVYMGIPAAPLWIGGLAFLILGPSMRPFRFLGIAFVALLAILIVVGSKPYYPAPAYSVLFAAGAVGCGRLFSRAHRSWLRPAAIATLTVLNLPFLPYSLPVLTVEQFLAYSKVVYVGPAFTFETGRQLELPQYFADMFGWEEQASVVARVYHSLTPEERARTAIYANNYGEAGAINLYGKRLGLPRAVSGHFSYFYWGPEPGNPDIVITVGGIREEDLKRDFGEVELAATIHHPHAIFYEDGIPVYVCRKPRLPLRELWPSTRDFG